jgi:acetyltransferase-like isoleucine patch superfamily enzyme
MRSSASSNVLGLSHPVILATLNRNARIVIGNGVGLSGVSICAADSISIGARTILGADVLITDTDHHAIAGPRLRHVQTRIPTAAVVVGSDVFVGARAIILKGSHIGDQAIIGAGSVVSGVVPSGAIVVGNPGRVIGLVAESETPNENVGEKTQGIPISLDGRVSAE